MPTIDRDHLLRSLADLGVVNLGILHRGTRDPDSDRDSVEITLILRGGVNLTSYCSGRDLELNHEWVIDHCRAIIQQYHGSADTLSGHDLDRMGDVLGRRRYDGESDGQFRRRLSALRPRWPIPAPALGTETALAFHERESGAEYRQRVRDAWVNVHDCTSCGVAVYGSDRCSACAAGVPRAPAKSRYTRLLEGVL